MEPNKYATSTLKLFHHYSNIYLKSLNKKKKKNETIQSNVITLRYELKMSYLLEYLLNCSEIWTTH